MKLRSLGDPRNVEGMARYGIRVTKAFGVSAPNLRALAKEIGRDHALAAELWRTGIHDARCLAALIDDPVQVTVQQMERWVKDFDSWAVCDCACGCLFDKTPHAWDKAIEWTERQEEYVKRAGFVLMATLAVHDKKTPDERFEAFLPLIAQHATDERNFVKKAVNWALRQIGKRSRRLNSLAVQTAERIRRIDSKSARWIASDALRELTNDKVRQRLKR
ncbi:MAG TPA: DNA alkylation repair protein [Sedimentisphaerales bacterium]|jgi:3-methyladenine DNA glycosylase AlkD|nr:DNA alkylation repair protein [Sedimentisphaerales bacterium]HNU27818.1 DNA alkylation repair protein [Sedimentisphaerales bacterium]